MRIAKCLESGCFGLALGGHVAAALVVRTSFSSDARLFDCMMLLLYIILIYHILSTRH